MTSLSLLTQALIGLKENEVYTLVEQRIKEGAQAIDIIKELNIGMTIIGERFSEGKYFINELLYSGEIMKNIMGKLGPITIGNNSKLDVRGKVVIGTVKGDIHDVGKNIVVMMLQGAGFEVIDLGVDVPAELFVEKVKETGTKVLGLSALLNFVFDEMKKVVDLLTEVGLRDQVKIIIGGAPCNEEVRKYTGADYYANDSGIGVAICKKIYGL